MLAAMLAACGGGGDGGATAAGGAAPSPSAATSTATPVVAAATKDAAAPAPAGLTISVRGEGMHAPFLVGPNGRTLYYFRRDEPGKSNCAGPCAQAWPPLLIAAVGSPAASGVTGKLGVITRADGGRHVTYEGWPLYYFAADQAPGDARGEGVENVWTVAKPGGPTPARSSATAGGTPAPGATPAASGDYGY